MALLDPERQQKAKEYARIRRRLWLADMFFSTAYALIWLFTGWAIGLRQGLQEWLMQRGALQSIDGWLVALFALIFGGIYAVLTLPLAYYSGFVLPHRFGQSTQTLKDWLLDQLKGIAIGAPLGLLLLELLYWALRVTGTWWWAWAAGGLFLFNVLLTNLAPVLILPIFNKYVSLGDEHAELAERLLKLAERSGTKVRGVFKFDMSRRTREANAALTGIGNTRRIILSDTLLSEFTADEIETVLAHELGHHVHRDIPLLIVFGAFITTVGLFLASQALNWAIGAFHFTSPADVAALPALQLILNAYGLLVTPLSNAVSRWRESLADDYALQMTHKGEAFASAFTRLANQNLGEVDPEKWVVYFFYSHPPLGERIEKARRFSVSH